MSYPCQVGVGARSEQGQGRGLPFMGGEGFSEASSTPKLYPWEPWTRLPTFGPQCPSVKHSGGAGGLPSAGSEPGLPRKAQRYYSINVSSLQSPPSSAKTKIF